MRHSMPADNDCSLLVIHDVFICSLIAFSCCVNTNKFATFAATVLHAYNVGVISS